MKMFTYAANDMRSINDFVNKKGIQQEQIVNVFSSADGTFMLVYFAEE